MRPSILLLASALAALPAAAQTPRVTRAFEPAFTPWVGVRNFGDRATSVTGARAGYGGSFTVGASFEAPMTRRTGFIVDLQLAPSAGQRLENEAGVVSYDNALGISLSALLAARLRPQAPVFVFAGGGVLAMTKKPVADADGATIEPMVDVGFGYDAVRVGEWNVRGIFHGYFLKPADPESPGFSAKGSAFDWSAGIGFRRTLGRTADATRTSR